MTRARFHLASKEDRAQAVEAVRRAQRGYVVEVRAPTRSLMQNARMWAMLEEVSAQVDWYGRKLTPEEWKCVFTAALKQQTIVPGIDGGFVAIGAHTSTMTIEELGDLMELMAAFGAERGVVFKDEFTPEPAGVDAGAPGSGVSGAGAPATGVA